MELDIRLPMGAMFVLLGGVLTIYGMLSGQAIYSKSLGININLWWGLVIFACGVVMLLLAWFGRVKVPLIPLNEQSVGDEGEPRR